MIPRLMPWIAACTLTVACGGGPSPEEPQPEPELEPEIEQMNAEAPEGRLWSAPCKSLGQRNGERDAEIENWFDARERLLRSERWTPDEGDEFTRKSLQTVTYDDENLTGEEVTQTPFGPPMVVIYGYDSRGNTLIAEEFRGEERTWSQAFTYAYDADDRLIRQQRFTESLSVSDTTWTWAYDADGNLLREATEIGDLVTESLYEYDADGNETKRHRKSSSGESITTTAWQDGNAVQITHDDDADGSADSITFRTYDDHGDWIREEYDSDADGTIDSASTQQITRDDDGRATEIVQDFLDDGMIDRTTAQTWHDNGQIERQVVSTDAPEPDITEWDEYGNVVFEALLVDVGTPSVDGYWEATHSYDCWLTPKPLPESD